MSQKSNLFGESNAISEAIEAEDGTEFEKSQISNQRFNEEMISTVLSEQIETKDFKTGDSQI